MGKKLCNTLVMVSKSQCPEITTEIKAECLPEKTHTLLPKQNCCWLLAAGALHLLS